MWFGVFFVQVLFVCQFLINLNVVQLSVDYIKLSFSSSYIHDIDTVEIMLVSLRRISMLGF